MAKSIYTIKIADADKESIMNQCAKWLEKDGKKAIYAFERFEPDKNGLHKYWYVVWQCPKCEFANHLYTGHLTERLKRNNGQLHFKCNCKEVGHNE